MTAVQDTRAHSAQTNTETIFEEDAPSNETQQTLTEQEMLDKFFANDDYDEREASEREIDELIEQAEEADEPKEAPFRETATEAEKYDASIAVLERQDNHRPLFYGVLKAARDVHDGRSLADAVSALPEMKLVSYPCSYFITELYDSGALDRALPEDFAVASEKEKSAEEFLNEEARELEAEAVAETEADADEPMDAEQQGEDEDASTEQSQVPVEPLPLDYEYTLSPVGMRVLEEYAPEKRMAKLFGVEEDLVPGLQAVLAFCDEMPRSRMDIEHMLKEKGYHVGLDLDSSFYTDSLERSGGLVWKDGWITTDGGKAMLTSSE